MVEKPGIVEMMAQLIRGGVPSDARRYPPDYRPWVYKRFQEMAKQAGIDEPELYISNDKDPNASTVCYRNRVVVNQGILDLLDDREMVAVLGHELGHRKHALSQGILGLAVPMYVFYKCLTVTVNIARGIDDSLHNADCLKAALDAAIEEKKKPDAQPKGRRGRRHQKAQSDEPESVTIELPLPVKRRDFLRRTALTLAGLKLGNDLGSYASSKTHGTLAHHGEVVADDESVNLSGDLEAFVSAMRKLKAQSEGWERGTDIFSSDPHPSEDQRIEREIHLHPEMDPGPLPPAQPKLDSATQAKQATPNIH